jgi:hypothetical protein
MEQSEEHVENFRNVLGTHLRLDEEIMGSWWEHIRNNKNPTSPTLPRQKKKTGCIECMLQFLIG